MRRRIALSSLSLIFSTIAAPLVSAHPTARCAGSPLTAQERIALRAIRQRIEDGLGAQEAKDVSASLRSMTLDFTLTLTDGNTLNRAQVEEGMKRDFAWILAISERTHIRITCLSMQGKEAIVVTDQHFVRTVPDRKNGSPHELITNVTHREIWIYTAEGWAIKHIQELQQGATFLDGEPYDP